MKDRKYTRAMKFILGDDYKAPEAIQGGANAALSNNGPTKVVAAVTTGSRPCPFCGDVRRPDIEETKDSEGSLFHAECQCCGAQGPMAITRGAALIQWDERHTPATQHEFVKLSDRLAGANKPDEERPDGRNS